MLVKVARMCVPLDVLNSTGSHVLRERTPSSYSVTPTPSTKKKPNILPAGEEDVSRIQHQYRETGKETWI